MTLKDTLYRKAFLIVICCYLSGLTAWANTIPIGYGETVAATLETAGEEDWYTFEGQSGDRIWIRMRDAESTIDACIQLYDPAGNIIGEHCRNGGIVTLKELKLPATGTYSILAKDNNDNDIGTYGLTLQVLNDPSYATPISCGQDWTQNIGKTVEVDAYRFQAQAGELVLFQMRSANPSLESELSLFDPNGNLIATAHSSYKTKIGPFLLPEDGVYQIMSTDYNGNDNGSYGMTFQVINRDSCSPTLTCGEESSVFSNDGGVVDFSINHLAELDAYHFPAVPGDAYVVQMYSPIKSFEVSIELYDRQGNLLKSSVPRYGLGRLEYSNFDYAGDYVLLVSDNNGNDLSSYGLFLEKVNQGGCGSSLNCANQGDGGELKENGAMKSYTFSSFAGSTASITVRPKEQIGLDPRLELYAPDGTSLFDEFSFGTVSLENLTLPQDGVYTILVSDHSGNDLGDYDLELTTDFILDLEAPTLVCSSPADLYYLEDGSLTLDLKDFVSEASDACSAVTIDAPVYTFTCDHIGINTITVSATDESGNTSTCDLTIQIEDNEGKCVADYCEAKGTSTAYEWIEKVTFAGLGNASGDNGGYGDFTDNAISLYRNAQYGLYLYPGYYQYDAARYWRVWIDWNRDGDFDDEGELIVQKKSQNVVKTVFTTPSWAASSSVVMRVVYQYGSYPNSCGEVEYGEVEDYLLTILDEPTCDDLPDEWHAANIGHTPIPGSVCYDETNPTFYVSGSGDDIFGTSDDFFFVYQELCGDGDIVTRLDAMTYPGEYALSGIMFRRNLKSGSANISMVASKDHGIIYQAREKFKNHTIYQEHEGSAPIWLKLTRRGNTISGYISEDAVDWELVCPFDIDLPYCVKVGLAVCSNNPTAVNESVFDQVEVIPGGVSTDLAGPGNEIEAIERSNPEETTPSPALATERPATIQVFPNPVVDQVQVDCPACVGQATTLRLYDLTGALVWESQYLPEFSQLSANFQSLALTSGTYLLSVQTNQINQVQKIMVQNRP